jgi:hypothetical protein
MRGYTENKMITQVAFIVQNRESRIKICALAGNSTPTVYSEA